MSVFMQYIREFSVSLKPQIYFENIIVCCCFDSVWITRCYEQCAACIVHCDWIEQVTESIHIWLYM